MSMEFTAVSLLLLVEGLPAGRQRLVPCVSNLLSHLPGCCPWLPRLVLRAGQPVVPTLRLVRDVTAPAAA